MAKIKITWTTQVTETHEAEVDYDDFAKAVDLHAWTDANGNKYEYQYPTLDQIKAGEVYVEDWDNIGAEFEDEAVSADVDSREIESIEILPA